MKFDRIHTRRNPVRKNNYARVFSKTKPKKHRASAAASHGDEAEGSGINISRSLTIIFAIHIVALGMIFIHKNYLSDRTPEPGSITENSEAQVEGAKPLPTLSDGDRMIMPKRGDSYSSIAAKHQIAEAALRNANPGIEVRPGTVLRVPASREVVATTPPEVQAIRQSREVAPSDRGLVEIEKVEPVAPAPLPIAAKPKVDPPKAVPVASSRTHVIKSGDNIWRISNTYKVSQKKIMEINNITDPTKLKIGQVIKLP